MSAMMTTTGTTTPIAIIAPVDRPLEEALVLSLELVVEDDVDVVAVAVAVERTDVVEAMLPADESVDRPLSTVAELLLDALAEVEALVAAAKSAAFHLICTLYAFNPSFGFVKLVVVVLVPAPSVATIVIGPSDTAVPIPRAHP